LAQLQRVPARVQVQRYPATHTLAQQPAEQRPAQSSIQRSSRSNSFGSSSQKSSQDAALRLSYWSAKTLAAMVAQTKKHRTGRNVHLSYYRDRAETTHANGEQGYGKA
jgi:hypothetical protein